MGYLDFDELPRSDADHVIKTFGLPDDEERIMRLRYVLRLSYFEIASTMHISEKTVGGALSRARKHMVSIAKSMYGLTDDRTRAIIDVLGWMDLEWPTLRNRHEKRALENQDPS